MRIDLHLHSSERSPCGMSKAEEMIEAALAAGLDGIAITDHDRLVPENELERLSARYAPFRIFAGIEIAIEWEHIVVLGLRDPALERRDWTWPALHRFVRERDGALFLAHPYRFQDSIEIDVERYRPDAIEVNSTNMGHCNLTQVKDLVDALGVHSLSNSDAHHSSLVGVYYNKFEKPIHSDAELAAAVRAGRSSPRRMEDRIATLNRAGGCLQ